MNKKNGNSDLNNAKDSKKDEFYTSLEDIKKELTYYKHHFKNQIVYCNCDNPSESNFYQYFVDNFKDLGLKKLILSHYTKDGSAHYVEYTPENTIKKNLDGNGDFRSNECIELLKQSTIIVTNPPFSLFREYVSQLIEHNKRFLIIGNVNALTYKDIFKLIRDNKIWIGASIRSGDREFRVPSDYALNTSGSRVDANGIQYIRVKGIRWFTNLDYEGRHKYLSLKNYFNPSDYPSYDNYDAIEINQVKKIPQDYDGIMGVPITFIDKYNPKQFHIIGLCASAGYDKDIVGIPLSIKNQKKVDARPIIKGKVKFARIFIKRNYS